MGETGSGRRRVLGHYELGDEIASGGMASVHIGRRLGPAGFARTVAIKRLNPVLARDPEFVAMFFDEARLAAQIHHPNVVPTLDVFSEGGDLFLVMEHVRGESLARLVAAAAAAGQALPVGVAVRSMIDALEGLHAAHEATTERGQPLGIVHRDVSPQNILVGTDGVARVLDFGIAKARFRLHSTHDGRLKGKLGYMAPEQLLRESVDNRCDVYGAAAVLWEILAGERLFTSDSHVELVKKIRTAEIPPPSARRATVPPSLDGVAMRGLQRRPEDRYATALDMARALEETGTAGPRREVGAWVRAVAGGEIDARVAQIEGSVSASGDASPVATEVVGEAPPARALLFDVRASDEGTPPPSRPRRARAALAGIAVAALGGSGLLWLSMSGSQRMPPVASAVVRETLDAAAPPPVRASPADPSTPASAAPAKPPRRRHLAKPTQPDCDPPFIIDAEGHKMFKEQCL